MFIYGIQSWGNQELLFIHEMKSLDNLCGYIKYIKIGYKKHQTQNPTHKGPRKNENILILYNLIDKYGWNSLMFRTVDFLVPESDNILYLTSTYEYLKVR